MYDPYGGQQPDQQMDLGDVVKENITYGIKPSSYFSALWVTPYMYSPDKGLRLPWVGKRLAEGTMGNLGKDLVAGFKKTYTNGIGNAIVGTFKGTSKFAGRSILMGMTLSSDKGFNIKGKGWGYEFLNKNYGLKKERYKKLAIGYAKKADVFKHKLYDYKITTLIANQSKGKISFLQEGEHLFAKKSENNLKKFKIAGSLIKRQNLSKWLLRGAKGISYIGLASMAWDLASLVGKPLVQAGINSLNNIAMEYQNRFMPEMGGQLQLSYLNQANATERQRAIQAISKSYINGRSAFGGEGKLMHDGY